MKGALATVEISVLCGWRFSNQFDILSETHFRCNTVGRKLKLAILCSLLCFETDWIIRIGKQGYVLILTGFKKWCLMFHSWHQSVCQWLLWDWEKLNFLKRLLRERFCLLGFVKLEIKQWFLTYQNQLCVWFKAETHDATNRCDTSPRQVAATNRLVWHVKIIVAATEFCRCDLWHTGLISCDIMQRQNKRKQPCHSWGTQCDKSPRRVASCVSAFNTHSKINQ